jgi:hypothetical protein
MSIAADAFETAKLRLVRGEPETQRNRTGISLALRLNADLSQFSSRACDRVGQASDAFDLYVYPVARLDRT